MALWKGKEQIMAKIVKTPITRECAECLRAGDIVLLSGKILVARDAAHKRLVEEIKAEMEIPFSLIDETIFYAGPAPTPPGKIIGPIGPTTSGRMDPYAVFLMECGVRGMIGKGRRTQEVLDAMKKYGAVYFGATGGTSVLLSNSVISVECLAYSDLGPESILRLEVDKMPLVVLADCFGGDVYMSGPAEAQRIIENLPEAAL